MRATLIGLWSLVSSLQREQKSPAVAANGTILDSVNGKFLWKFWRTELTDRPSVEPAEFFRSLGREFGAEPALFRLILIRRDSDGGPRSRDFQAGSLFKLECIN